MIAFACSHCGKPLQVHDQFAGRQSKCPACKQSLVVPGASVTVPSPRDSLGLPSSLSRAGLNGGVTLSYQDTHHSAPPLAAALLANHKNQGERYAIEGEIARGGMGAVLRAVDCDIRREVAVKYLLDQNDPRQKARFVEEAQITGQLEHPNIVPIHELGIDAQKKLFFSMKMVKGRSLKEVFDQLRDNPKQAEKEYTLGRLLGVLVNVCHALAYAHSRGVIHRDLKPANIMLGDFGEVYVMDWGLAKVLGQESATQVVGAQAPSTSRRDSKVVTNRAAGEDLTVQGSVLGTPVYMPPEQAAGKIADIDARSDVYSLGAILYEMLTLLPPVLKEGGQLGVLMQVVQGEILPPEKRTPNRASKIPRELSALAMKALAKEREQRYQTVEALRRDIERFQEGRSVSAKDDTFVEAIWRLIKRNKLASAFTAVLVVVLLWSSWTNFQARRGMEQAQEEKRKQAQQAVPALVKAIKLMIADGEVDAARVQATAAVEADPHHAEARLLKAQLLIAQRDLAAANQELERCLQLQPDDASARKLSDLCRKARPDDVAALFSLAEELSRQRRFALAERLTKFTKETVGARDHLLAHYRKRIEDAWSGAGAGLTMDARGQLELNLENRRTIRDLGPLRNMPLTALNLNMPADKDSQHKNELRDLSALQGMPLKSLQLANCYQLQDITPLKGMPLTGLNLGDCHQIQDFTPLQGMKLTWLSIWSTRFSDLSLLSGMPLTSLNMAHTPVKDLTPLQALPLTSLNIAVGPVGRDLKPLKGMKLSTLELGHYGSPLVDIAPLEGMPLTRLDMYQTRMALPLVCVGVRVISAHDVQRHVPWE